MDDEFIRCCIICGHTMTEGYIVEDSSEYFCSDDCLYAYYTVEEYYEMFNNDIAYWTMWEE